MVTKINKGNWNLFKELIILEPFFKDPEKGFQIREISRIVKLNHVSIRKYLNQFVNAGYLEIRKDSLYPLYYSKISKQYLNLKLFYNLEKLRSSNLIEFLEKEFDYPQIVLFGSYAKAMDSKNSDIDICIISEINKEPQLEKYESILNKKIQLHLFNKKIIYSMKIKNPGLLNNILNGFVVSGELEII